MVDYVSTTARKAALDRRRLPNDIIYVMVRNCFNFLTFPFPDYRICEAYALQQSIEHAALSEFLCFVMLFPLNR